MSSALAFMMTHVFTILAPTQTQQPNGEVVTTYASAGTFSGGLAAVSGDETHDANVERTEVRFDILALHRTDITPNHRLSLGSRIFQVEYARDAGGHTDPDEYILIRVVLHA